MRITLIISCIVLGVFSTFVHGGTAFGQINWLNPTSGNWNDGTNWDGGTVPDAADNVVVNVFGAPYTITLDVNTTVDQFSLQSADATFSTVGRTFEATTGTSISSGTVVLSNTNWNGGLIDNTGLLYAYSNRINTVNIAGGITNNAGGEIRIRSWGSGSFYGVTNFNVNNGLDNSGLIKLTTSPGGASATANLNVNSGTLTNQVGGVIEAAVGENAGGHGRYINAINLVNHGTIVNNDASELNFNKAGSSVQNAGAINFTAGDGKFSQFASLDNQLGGTVTGRTVTLIGQSSSTSTINNAGLIDLDNGDLSVSTFNSFTNSGTVDVSGGNMTFNGAAASTFNNSGSIVSATGRSISFVNGTYDHNGGTISGAGGLTFSGTDLLLHSDFSMGADSTVMLNVNGNGTGKIITQAGTLTRMDNSTFANHFENNGTLQANYGRINTVNANGGITNNAGGEVTVRSWGGGSFYGLTNFNVNNGIDNSGLIKLTTSPGGASATANLNVNSGTLTNQVGGVIEAAVGENAGGHGRYINAINLVNHGTIVNNDASDLNFNKAGSSVQNAGAINFTAGDGKFSQFASLDNQLGGTVTGRTVTLIGQSSSTSTINNAGLIDLDNGDLSVSTFNSFTNSGTVDVSGGNMTFNGAAASTFNNSGSIVSATGRSISFVNGTYDHNGGTISGAGGLTFNGINMLLNTDFNLGADSTVILNANGTGPGKFITQAGTLTRMDTSTFANHFENNGTLQANYGRINTVNANGGITNNAGGEVTVRSWGSGSFYGITRLKLGSSNLVNHGTVAFAASPGNASASSIIEFTTGALVNYGTIEFREQENAGGIGYQILGQLINHGSLINASSADIVLNQSNTNHENHGLLSLTGGDMTLQGSNSTFVNTVNGTIKGTHRLNLASGMTLANQGEIAPGASPGQLTIAGNVDFDSSSLLSIELAGLNQGIEYDYLSVLGSLDLDGELAISLDNGFTPGLLDSFTIVTATSITGNFSNLTNTNQVAFDGGFFDVSVTGNSVILSNFNSIPEPVTLPLLMLTGLAMASIRRRKTQAEQA